LRQKLDYIDLENWRGLNTKSSPSLVDNAQLVVAKNTDHFSEYGALTKPPGMSRILSSIYTESAAARQISWVGFYKAPDLNGQILRHVIVAAGTKLHRIDSGSLTALTGSSDHAVPSARTEGLFATSAQFDDLLLIQNQDPDLIGKGDFPVKYDGSEIQRWGLLAPGSLETVRETFSSASSFTTSGVTASNESTTTQDGAAVKINKTSTSQVNGDLTKTIAAVSIDNTITNRGLIYIYIPRGQLKNFAEGSTKAVEIFLGPDLTTNYYTFSKDKGSLFEGWNAIFLNFYNKLNNEATAAEDIDDPEVTITGSPGTSSLNNLRLRINSATASTTITGVVWDKFVTFDKGALVATESSSSASLNTFKINSKYKYKVTFVNKYGHESNAGPESRLIKLSAAKDQIDLTDIPVSTDPQVVARKLYRTVNGGEIFLFLDTIENNTVTTYSDITSDISNSVGVPQLGQVSPPLEGDISDDNNPPPQSGIVFKWQRTVFLAGMPDRPDVIVWSEDDEPESFPTLNESRLDAKITAIYEAYSGLVIETELGKWQVSGDNPDFQFNKVINNIGCVGRRAAGEARVSGYAVDRDGVRLYDLNNPIKISEVIRDKFDGFNKQNIELIHSCHSKNRNAILFFIPDSAGDYTSNNFIYQYPLDQIANGYWWQLDLPSSVNPLHVREIEDSNGDFHLYMGGDDGMIYELFNSDSKNWINAGGSTSAITFEATTDWIRLAVASNVRDPERSAGAYSGRIQPRFIELRYSGDASTWTVKVDTGNGPSQTTPTGTTTVSLAFASGETALRYPVPPIQAGEYVKLTIKNEQLNVAGTITGLRLYYNVQPGTFPIETGQLIDQSP